MSLLALLLACAHQSPIQTGVYFYKGYLDARSGDTIIADFTFEITPSVCELVISTNGSNESYLCTVKEHRSHSLLVYFESYRSAHRASISNPYGLAHGEKMFTLSLKQGRYITEWEGIYPSQQNARLGTYFLHTYQK